ncbi:mannosyltransferase [Zygosaccharomyces mellis]|uniref:Chitobiosyldiphosphodolichol beta-mannosyltransferase n=1 Tax=Zygosaccharomyces mellis TaxID=42258 RepID=A0A4C2E4H9_9SACH|nr:mannosyltransferase [Zygosaccharomyces mellis]
MLVDINSKWWLLLIGVYVVLPILGYFLVPFLFYGDRSTRKRVIVYVVGDIGHSPRMCNQAVSFSDHGWQVELCGYVDGDLPRYIVEDTKITVHALPRLRGPGMSGVVFMMKKVFYQFFEICKHLWRLRGSDYILMQNPPTIPLLPIAVLFRLTGCKLIIDWHNLGYSILQLKFGGSFWHPFVIIYFLTEWFFAKFAAYHLTVTKAMKNYLVTKFGLNPMRIAVLYDRPAVQFKPLANDEDRSRLLKEEFVAPYIPKGFDISKGDKIIATSTSFTPDEDLGILFGALKIYENSYQKFDHALPRILCFVTGKGPLKEKYMKEVREFQWTRCHIEFVWLSPENYPRLISLCDYGVSLHKSSSGVDLPMKILDMLGCGVPAMAYNYDTLDELINHDINGLKFLDRRELHEALVFAVKDPNVQIRLRKGALLESRMRWNSSWETAMKEIKLLT